MSTFDSDVHVCIVQVCPPMTVMYMCLVQVCSPMTSGQEFTGSVWCLVKTTRSSIWWELYPSYLSSHGALRKGDAEHYDMMMLI